MLISWVPNPEARARRRRQRSIGGGQTNFISVDARLAGLAKLSSRCVYSRALCTARANIARFPWPSVRPVHSISTSFPLLPDPSPQNPLSLFPKFLHFPPPSEIVSRKKKTPVKVTFPSARRCAAFHEPETWTLFLRYVKEKLAQNFSRYVKRIFREHVRAAEDSRAGGGCCACAEDRRGARVFRAIGSRSRAAEASNCARAISRTVQSRRSANSGFAARVRKVSKSVLWCSCGEMRES